MWVSVRSCGKDLGHRNICQASMASLSSLLKKQKVYFLEGWPVLGFSSPATEHQLIHRVGANGWLREIDLPPLVSEELSSVLNNLLIRQLRIGLLLAKGEGLPQSHPKGPHIACCGEFAQQDAFPGHPADGEHRPALDPVVVTAVQVSAHPKISYLNGVILAH